MKIKEIQLNNFKRFDKLTIQLGNVPKKIVALVGPNGCGKSSIFDAFEEIQKKYKGANYTPSNSFLHKLFHSEGPESQGYDRSRAVKIIKGDGTENFDLKSFYIRTSYRFTPSINVTAIQKQQDILADSNRPGSSAQLDARLTENYERLLGQSIDEWDVGDKSGPQLKQELLGSINGILSQVLDIEISSLGNVVTGKGQLYFNKGKSKNFPYENLSSGEKEVVDIVLDLIVKRGTYTDTVYCIDEPELHLNTAIQRRLLVEIEKLIPEGCQLWIATHSIGFLRALQEELRDKVAVLDFSGRDFDSPVELEPMQLTRKNWQSVFETALEDLTGLLAPKRIVYCEGRPQPSANGDELGFDAIAYNQIFSEEFPDTLFISSGGNTELEKNSSIALTILNKAFSEVEVVLLKDKDINVDGTPTTDEQRQEWLDVNPNNRRMLSRKEIENYICDFEILSKKYPEITEEQYKAIIPDIVTGEVKDRVGDLMRLCGVLTGKNKESFKLELVEEVTPKTAVYTELKGLIFQ